MTEASAQIQPKRLTFTIPGRLGAWQRTRVDTRNGLRVFNSDKLRSDQGIIRQIAWVAMRDQHCVQLQGPLRLTVETFRTRPASWSAKKQAAAVWITTKPDFDNTLKLVADALNNLVYGDDAQIADGRHIKQYASQNCVVVTLEELGLR